MDNYFYDENLKSTLFKVNTFYFNRVEKFNGRDKKHEEDDNWKVKFIDKELIPI